MKQVFRKELNRRIENDREFVEYEYHSFEDFLTVDELNAICDIHGDDCEAAYDYGVAFDYNDDLTWIDGDKFLSWAEDYLNDNKDEDSRGAEYEIIENVKKKLEKYQGFDVWF
jgi:hypothetical protein